MLLSIGAVLRESGFQVSLLDAQAERLSPEAAARELIGTEAVVLSTSSMTFREDVRFLGVLKARNARVRVILFGAHPTHMPRYCLASEHIDVVVRGEPEFLVRECLGALASGETVDKGGSDGRPARGFSYKTGEKLEVGGQGEPIDDLDNLPFMAVDLLPHGVEYFNPIAVRTPYMTMMTSRGCPGQCIFCPVPAFYGRKVRCQSAERVVAEFEFLKKSGYNELYLRDENFTAVPSRVARICEGIIGKNLDMSWVCNARIGSVDKELMKLMKAAGCHLLKFGVESGVQRILDISQKGISLEETERTLGLAREIGIDTHAHMMLGMPGETLKTLEQTIRFAIRIRPTSASFGICTPLPGTRLFDMVAERFPEVKDGSACDLSRLHSTSFFSSVFSDVPAEVLEEAMRRAYRAFYMRLGYLPECVHQLSGADAFPRLLRAGVQLIAFGLWGD
jgi:radical SAM superfamily enzyme YgiQ (UPF0313 family)